MQTPKDRLEQEIQEALKSGDKLRLATLRLLLAAVTNERIRSGEEVQEEDFLQLVQRAIKQRRDSAEQYRQGGRDELADAEEAESRILAGYLPPQVDEAELRAAIEEFVKQEGLVGPAAIGRIMKEMMGRFKGQAEGGTINAIARDVLSRQAE